LTVLRNFRIAVTERPYVAIVERAQRGDLAAFAELVVSFQDLAVGTAFGWLGEIELARDATQEAFLEVHLHLQELRERAAFPAWLRKLVIKHCDRTTRKPRIRFADIDVALDVPAPAADFAAAERAEWLRLAVEGLPAAERIVVALHYFAEVSGPALAEFLELPLSTVKKRLRRARARLREEGDRLMQKTIDAMRPSKTREFAAEVTFFMALRAGDRVQVAQMLARSPALAHAQQQWEPSLVYERVLPFASRATALLTAIERDDIEMQTLLLDAGANVDGACGCATGESPVWAAALLNRIAHLRALLKRGANPNVVAASGNTPLHVAAMRGYRDVAIELLAHGARTDAIDAHGRTPADWAESNGHADLGAVIESGTATAGRTSTRADASNATVLFSGIKALDLFVPIPRGGLVRFPFMAGVGMMVLLGELCKRLTTRSDGRALWTGFTQRPFDLRDWEAEMAELGLAARVQHSLVGFDADPQQRRDAFAAGLDRAEAMRDEGHDVLVVLLCDSGYESEVDASLVRLSDNRGNGSITTIVVTPFPEKREAVWTELAPPYKAQIVLDRRRAKKALLPSIDPLLSLSEPLDAGKVGARHTDIAARARQLIADYVAIDPGFELLGTARGAQPAPDLVRAHRLLGYLRQPFLVAEPFTGRLGQWLSEAQLLDDVESILSDRGGGSAETSGAFTRPQ
jgi:RNA polymerase sigma factor (sigma-70 family)